MTQRRIRMSKLPSRSESNSLSTIAVQQQGLKMGNGPDTMIVRPATHHHRSMVFGYRLDDIGGFVSRLIMTGGRTNDS